MKCIFYEKYKKYIQSTNYKKEYKSKYITEINFVINFWRNIHYAYEREVTMGNAVILKTI